MFKKRLTIKTIYSARFTKRKPWFGLDAKLYEFEFVGDGFLKHMIRNMVGLLVEIGLGKKEINSVKEILKHRDRKMAGLCAPSYGLYLIDIVI